MGRLGVARFLERALNAGQIVAREVENGLLFADDLGAEVRHVVVFNAFRGALERRVSAPVHSFSLFHGAREGQFMASHFRLWEMQYTTKSGHWTDKEHDISDDQSYLAHIDGTGKPVIEARSRDWIGTGAEGTSRAAIWSFCDALHSGKDRFSGGPPQLVGMWRKGPAQTFGILWHGKRYLAGLEVTGDAIWESVPWFNNLFERCDGKTGSRLKSAQRHPKPNRTSQAADPRPRKAERAARR